MTYAGKRLIIEQKDLQFPILALQVLSNGAIKNAIQGDRKIQIILSLYIPLERV